MKKTHYYLVDTSVVTQGAAVSELQFNIIKEDPFIVHGLKVNFLFFCYCQLFAFLKFIEFHQLNFDAKGICGLFVWIFWISSHFLPIGLHLFSRDSLSLLKQNGCNSIPPFLLITSQFYHCALRLFLYQCGTVLVIVLWAFVLAIPVT